MTSTTMASTADTNTSIEPRQFSAFVVACFTLNYTMGTGILVLPWAFHKAGLILSTLCVVVVCILGMVCSDYMLSAIARAEAIQTVYGDNVPAVIQVEETMVDSSSLLSGPHEKDAHGKTLLTVQKSKLETTDLCLLFLGRKAGRIYILCIILYVYGLLWTFATVFGKSMTEAFPIFTLSDEDSYLIYVGVFALFVVPLSFIELREQVSVQVAMAFCRLIVVLIFVFTPLFVAYNAGRPAGCSFNGQTDFEKPKLWDSSGFHLMIPVVNFAILFHHGIPSVAREADDKFNLHHNFSYTQLFCAASFLFVGFVDSWFFEKAVHQTVNLNWVTFGCMTKWSDVVAWISAFFVLMFPCVDVVSAFPLHSIVLSSSLKSAFYGRPKLLDRKKQIIINNLFKFFASVPPLIGALFVRNPGAVTDFTGLICFALLFLWPSLLYIYSELKMMEYGLTTNTRYKRWGSSYGIAVGIFLFGFGFMLYTSYLYIRPYV